MLLRKRACMSVVVATLLCSYISLSNGGYVKAYNIANNSVKIKDVNISELFIQPDETSCTSASTSVENYDLSRGSGSNQLITYAYNFLGTPYVYGANGPKSFDCSGFTKYVFAAMAINIPRTSQEQYSRGNVVNRDNLQSGDLVFFNTDTTLGHVGIYIGNSEFIHASCSRGVTISSLNSQYYSSKYAGAVRY